LYGYNHLLNKIHSYCITSFLFDLNTRTLNFKTYINNFYLIFSFDSFETYLTHQRNPTLITHSKS